MIDVNKITSTLAKLPDPQLQQYAQMHKNDPYIMALAMSESNRRKEMRAAGQGGQGMQEQPKVVDQMLAEMAPQQMPEDQGIGQLPAGEMNFAGGGIIAFADGGDVERYQSQGLVQPRARWEEELERLQAPPQESSALGRGIVGAFTYSSDFEALVQSAKAKQASGIPLTAPEARALQLSTTPLGAPAKSGTMPEPGYTRGGFEGDPRLNTPPTQPVVAAPAAPIADTARKGPGAGPSAAAPAPAQTAAQRYAAMQKELEPDRTKMDQGIAALGTSMRTAAKGELEDFEKDVAERGVAFAGREARLAKREEGLSKRKDENMGLSLLEAGLSIMSTPGNLATAIGKGAQVGLKTYGTGLKDLRAAQEKMDDARDQIEEFRRNEANMTAKERRQFKSAINRTETEIEKLGLSAAEKMYGYKREDAKTVFTADTQERLTDKEIRSREKIARESAGRNNQLEMLQALQADPQLMATYRTMQGKNEDVMGQYTDFLKANPALALDPKAAFTQFLMTKSAFQQLGASPVTEKAAGPVRKQP
jgi:hypothetical protein